MAKPTKREPKQQRAVEKRNAVLDACTRLLARDGYAETSMLELSMESDVAVATIYQYFLGKEDIFLSWFDRLLQQSLDSAISLVQTHESVTPGEFVEASISHVIDLINADKESIKRLLNELPQVLLSEVIDASESKLKGVLVMVVQSTGADIGEESLDLKLTVLINAIFGFLIQMILRDIVTVPEKTSKELALLVHSYFQVSGIDISNTAAP